MTLEMAAIVLGIEYEQCEDFAIEVGADPDAISPADLLAMASLRDDLEDDEDFEDE